MDQYGNDPDYYYQPQGGDDFAQLQPFPDLHYDGGFGQLMENLGPIIQQNNVVVPPPPQIPPAPPQLNIPPPPPPQQRQQLQPQGRPVPIVEKIRPEGLQRDGKRRKRRSIVEFCCFFDVHRGRF